MQLLKPLNFSSKGFNDVVIFQGNITNPIFNNIYLHELDLFMESLSKSLNKGKSRKASPAYKKLQYKMGKLDDVN